MQGHPAKTACQREPSVRSCTSGRQFLRRSVTLNKSVQLFCALLLSPSMRRVWIEITRCWMGAKQKRRHPPCGGCGLKCAIRIRITITTQTSPSMRRVWIEISFTGIEKYTQLGHPPCGGCGLKSRFEHIQGGNRRHPPCGGCGLKYTMAISLYGKP